MNCMSARCRRATLPCMTEKRVPVIFPAMAASSCPSFSPMSTWSKGWKSNDLGVPQTRTSWLSSSLSPSGTARSGILGVSSNRASRASWASLAAAVASSRSRAICSRMVATWALASSTVSPEATSSPIFFDADFRSASKFWERTSASLRRASSCKKLSTGNWWRFFASASATAWGSLRTTLISSMVSPDTGRCVQSGRIIPCSPLICPRGARSGCVPAAPHPQHPVHSTGHSTPHSPGPAPRRRDLSYASIQERRWKKW